MHVFWIYQPLYICIFVLSVEHLDTLGEMENSILELEHKSPNVNAEHDEGNDSET
ncbi:hypothetical protein FGIG_10109 [Fasciola gigantica]|uniref:Uncharacterized protein n=1 Tax=Fasciola gigantica TaxID=46835 RepID=A0A504YU11_FASGI|nr:hypothetical protein FGIG_10109 [Fasciola gigantica]